MGEPGSGGLGCWFGFGGVRGGARAGREEASGGSVCVWGGE